MPPSVFISYSHTDRRYVKKLVRYLTEQGVSFWRDSELHVGDTLSQVIQNKINECLAFVLVVTPAAIDSEWVRNELTYARKLDKKILPLKLIDGNQLFLGNLVHEDVTGGRLPSTEFIDQLRKLAAREQETALMAGGGPRHARPTAPRPDPAQGRLASTRWWRRTLGLRRAHVVIGVILAAAVTIVLLTVLPHLPETSNPVTQHPDTPPSVRASSPAPSATPTAAPTVTASAEPAPTATRQTDWLAFSVAAGPVDETMITPLAVFEDVQLLVIHQSDNPQEGSGHLTLHAGSIDSAQFVDAVSTPVNGKQGWYALAPDLDGKNEAKLPTLAWQYAQDSWAMLQADLTPAALSSLASNIKIIDPYPAKVPCRFTYLPASLRPVAVFQNTTILVPMSVIAFDSRPDLPPYERNVEVREFIFGALPAQADPTSYPDVIDAKPGWRAEWLSQGVKIHTGTWELSLLAGTAQPRAAPSRTELEKMINSMTCGEENPNGWFNATSAFPR